MKYLFVFLTIVIGFKSTAQSKKEQIYELNQEVASLYDKINKLEIIQGKYADSMQMMHTKYIEDTEILRLQIDVLNARNDKTIREYDRIFFVRDSIYTSQIKIAEHKVKSVYDSIEGNRFRIVFVYNENLKKYDKYVYYEDQLAPIHDEKIGRSQVVKYDEDSTEYRLAAVYDDVSDFIGNGRYYVYNVATSIEVVKENGKYFIRQENSLTDGFYNCRLWSIGNEGGELIIKPYNGKWESHDKRGILIEKSDWVAGKLHEQVLYNEKEQITSICINKGGEKVICTYKNWHANGKLAREANGFLDTINSQKCWDEEGNEIECPEYY
jgi:hypothetical protein